MKGLEALEEIKNDLEYITRLDYVEPIVRGEVRDKLFQIYHRELPQLDQIEKELKALEIIKNKRVQVEYLVFIVHDYKYCATEEQVELYNKKCAKWNALTKDEFDLLKEVFK